MKIIYEFCAIFNVHWALFGAASFLNSLVHVGLAGHSGIGMPWYCPPKDGHASGIGPAGSPGAHMSDMSYTVPVQARTGPSQQLG